jgi:hypothetical protein
LRNIFFSGLVRNVVEAVASDEMAEFGGLGVFQDKATEIMDYYCGLLPSLELTFEDDTPGKLDHQIELKKLAVIASLNAMDVVSDKAKE